MERTNRAVTYKKKQNKRTEVPGECMWTATQSADCRNVPSRSREMTEAQIAKRKKISRPASQSEKRRQQLSRESTEKQRERP